MEGKLLKLNRFMSNFSTKLVGGFVPVIVYKYAPEPYKMQLALLTCAIQYLFSFVMNIILKKVLVKKPQVFVFLRLFPIILYEILLIYVETNPILCVVGIGLGFSLSYVFKLIPTEVIFAYNHGTRRSGTGVQLATNKLIDQIAIIIGTIVGGIALDYWDLKILVIISIVLYFIGAFPMLIYYLLHRKNGKLNQEYSTLEHITLKEMSYDTEQAKAVSKQITKTYKIFYFLQESYNAMYILIPLLIFTITGKFTNSAFAGALFDGLWGISSFVFGKLEHKKDITNLSIIGGIVLGVCSISLIFIKSENLLWLFYLLIGLMAISYGVTYIFMYNRMLMKSKIVGRNTEAIINKINMYFLSTFVIVSFGLFLPITSCFCIAGGFSIASGVVSKNVEEKTRRILVDHLEDNEIKDDYSILNK